MTKKLRILAAALAALASSVAGAAAKMTNQDVVDMVQAKMSEGTIVKAIESAESGFDTSAKALIKLNAAKIPENVIQAMIDAQQGGRSPADTAVAKSGTVASAISPEEIFLIDGTEKTAMRYVTPQTRTAVRGLGYGGSATYAVLPGPQAALRLKTNQPTFLVAIPSSVQPESYLTLASLATRRNGTREVVISNSGFASVTSGITKDRIQPTRVEKDTDQSKAPAGFTLYRMSPASPLASGEYTMVLANSQVKVAGYFVTGNDSYFDFGIDG